MGKRKFGIVFKGFEEMIAKYQSLGGDTKRIVEECLEVAPDIINPKLKTDMAKHNRQHGGKHVVDTIVENQHVVWEGTKAKLPLGFNLSKGGVPSIFLMFGTARHAPANQYGTYNGIVRGVTQDKTLHDDLYGTAIKRKINEKQKEIFAREIKKKMGDK